MISWHGFVLGALASVVATAAWAAPGDIDPKTDKPILDIFRESPNSIPLDPRDPFKDVTTLNRDCPDKSRRDPGPIDVQRAHGGLAYQGIPTFFHAPVAFCPEDLKAGKVDVAIMGAPVDLSLGTRGTAWGPQAVRTGEVTIPWGSFFRSRIRRWAPLISCKY
jgi:agmatinase